MHVQFQRAYANTRSTSTRIFSMNTNTIQYVLNSMYIYLEQKQPALDELPADSGDDIPLPFDVFPLNYTYGKEERKILGIKVGPGGDQCLITAMTGVSGCNM